MKNLSVSQNVLCSGKGFFRFLKNCSEEGFFFGGGDSFYVVKPFIIKLYYICVFKKKKRMLTWSATACLFYMFCFLCACVYFSIKFFVFEQLRMSIVGFRAAYLCVAKNVISACELSVCVWVSERERSSHAVISSVTESKHSHFS